MSRFVENFSRASLLRRLNNKKGLKVVKDTELDDESDGDNEVELLQHGCVESFETECN